MKYRLLVATVLLASMVLGLSSACNEVDYCVETLNVGALTGTSATLCGTLTNERGDTVQVGFSFWKTDVYLQEQNPTVLACADPLFDTDIFYYDVTGLQPGTSYSYKAWSQKSGGNKLFGATVSFNTEGPSTSTVVATGGTSNLTSSSVTLHGEVVSMGVALALYVEIRVGTASGALNSIYTITEAIQAPGVFSVDLTGLSPDTTYYYRAAGSSANAVVTPGEERSFKTLL